MKTQYDKKKCIVQNRRQQKCPWYAGPRNIQNNKLETNSGNCKDLPTQPPPQTLHQAFPENLILFCMHLQG